MNTYIDGTVVRLHRDGRDYVVEATRDGVLLDSMTFDNVDDAAYVIDHVHPSHW